MVLPAALFSPADAGRHWFSSTDVPFSSEIGRHLCDASGGTILPSFAGRFPVSPDFIRSKRTKRSTAGPPPGIGQTQSIHEEMGNDEMKTATALAAVALRMRARAGLSLTEHCRRRLPSGVAPRDYPHR
jgi:hypothetical protein